MNDTQAIVTGLVSVVGSAIVAWFTSRTSRAASAEMAKVHTRQTEIDGMDRLVHNLEIRVDKLAEELSTTQAELRRVEEEAARLHDRVRQFEQERIRDRALIRHLIGYVNVLRGVLHAAHMPIPEAPAGLDLDGGPLS